MEIGDLITNHSFVVPDIPCGVILGTDFRTKNSMDILFSQHRLQWTEHGKRTMEATSPANQPETLCYCVALTEDLIIPRDYREMIVLADVVNDFR